MIAPKKGVDYGDNSETQALNGLAPRIRIRTMSLIVSTGPNAGRRVDIQKSKFVVGKDPSCDLFLKEPTVSRRHFEIETRQNEFIIRDYGSTNGTVVDGTRVNEAYLSPGSRISIGSVTLLFQPVYDTPEDDLPTSEAFGQLVAMSPSMKPIFGLLRKAANSGATVLLRGETGVGKSALARALHEEGSRKDGPFVVFDCASVAPTLIESELFGAEKGAYTGAVKTRKGACEQAQGGTLFIDEIDDLPIELQPKLLRILEEREVRRLGSTKSTSLDISLVCSSKFDLETYTRNGKFRRDLYYRIAVIDIEIPPLRDRREDIPVLSDRFCEDTQGAHAWSRMTPKLKDEFLRYTWPGNLRELRNVLERLRCIGPEGMPSITTASQQDDSDPLDFDFNRPFKEAKEDLIEAFEKEYLGRLLERSNGRIAPAAREAGINRKYFYDLLNKHGLKGKHNE